MNAPTVAFEVAQRFHGLRHRYIAVNVIAYLAMAVAAIAAFWMALALGDYVWEWAPFTRRVLAVVALLSVAGVFGYRITTLFGDSRQNRFAGNLERRFESLGQRLRTVLDSVDGRLKAPDAMLSALGHQTLGRWETASPMQIIPQRTAMIAGGACVALLTVAAMGLFIQSDWRLALLRTLGQEHPYTTLVVTPGDARILEGSLINLSLELQGRTNRSVMLRYREQGSESWVESELLPAEIQSDALSDGNGSPAKNAKRSASFACNLGKLVQPIDYQFITSAGSTKLYRIEVQHLIEMKKLEASVTPPAYTRLDSRIFNSADVSVLEGSQVVVTIETNHPLVDVSLEIGEKVGELKSSDVTQSKLPTQWAFTLPSDRSLHWQIIGRGVDGTPMLPVKGRLRVRYDEPPRIDWRDPEDEVKVHMLAELPMRAQISDDYGVMEAGIIFQLGDEEEFVLTQWSATEQAGDGSVHDLTTQVKLDELLPLESFALSERDFVAYYAYAIDNREGREQRIESDVRFIDIRPLRQFFSESEDQPGMGQAGPPIPELDEIIRRERFLINRTRKFVRNPNADVSNQLASIERMVESQSELADLTRFLMEFLISRGNDDTEALSQAEASMLQAADSLAVANFPTALVQEEDALRALAEARRSIELSFTNSPTKQQLQEMQRFRRQLQQKLRRTPAKSDQQLADSLKQVAIDQARVAADAKKLAVNLPSLQKPSDAPEGPNSESADVNAVEEKAVEEKPAEEKPAEVEPVQELLARQQDLLERLQTINEGLSAAVKRSALVEKRMQDAVREMDDLVGKLRADNVAETVVPAHELAGGLRELAIHIDSLAQPEPSNYVSAIRDLTTSLANMESEMAGSTEQLNDIKQAMQAAAAETSRTLSPSEATNASPTGGTSSEVKPSSESKGAEDAKDNGENEATNAPRAAEDPAEAKLLEQRADIARMGRRLDDRAATIEDVLKTPIDASNLAASEVSDKLNRLVTDNELLSDIADSRAAVQQDDESNETAQWSAAAEERAKEYADVATQLDQMYRQLVTPRVDLLRQLEAEATRLSERIGANADDSPQPPKPSEEGKTFEMQRDDLQNGLTAAGLEEIAEILNEGGGEEGEQSQSQGTSGSDPAALDGMGQGLRANRFSIAKSQDLFGKLFQVQKELRSHIQELILLEIATDRNAAVPAQYRELVDGYFRSITGDEVSLEERMAP